MNALDLLSLPKRQLCAEKIEESELAAVLLLAGGGIDAAVVLNGRTPACLSCCLFGVTEFARNGSGSTPRGANGTEPELSSIVSMQDSMQRVLETC